MGKGALAVARAWVLEQPTADCHRLSGISSVEEAYWIVKGITALDQSADVQVLCPHTGHWFSLTPGGIGDHRYKCDKCNVLSHRTLGRVWRRLRKGYNRQALDELIDLSSAWNRLLAYVVFFPDPAVVRQARSICARVIDVLTECSRMYQIVDNLTVLPFLAYATVSPLKYPGDFLESCLQKILSDLEPKWRVALDMVRSEIHNLSECIDDTARRSCSPECVHIVPRQPSTTDNGWSDDIVVPFLQPKDWPNTFVLTVTPDVYFVSEYVHYNTFSKMRSNGVRMSILQASYAGSNFDKFMLVKAESSTSTVVVYDNNSKKSRGRSPADGRRYIFPVVDYHMVHIPRDMSERVRVYYNVFDRLPKDLNAWFEKWAKSSGII